MEDILAAIDIGTHTARLLIAHLKKDIFIPLETKRIITKLGMFASSGTLAASAVHDLIQVLKQYKKEMSLHKVADYRAVATAVLRMVRNKKDVIRKICEETGINLEVIDGQTEAKLSAKGVLSTLNIFKTPALIVDIGGGSTELISLGTVTSQSVPLGSSLLSQRFLKSDPPLATEIDMAFKETQRILEIAMKNFPQPAVLIGTAGTISTLAAIDLKLKVYQPALVNGYTLTKERIKEVFDKLTSLPAVKRCQIPGLEKGREEIILGGIIIILSLMEILEQPELIVSEGGLLEGILVDLAETKRGLKGLKFIY